MQSQTQANITHHNSRPKMCDSDPQFNTDHIHTVIFDQCKKYGMVWEMLRWRDFDIDDWFGIDLEWLNLWSFLKIYNFYEAVFIAHDKFYGMFLLRVIVWLVYNLRVSRARRWWGYLGIECELHCWYFTFNWWDNFTLMIAFSLPKVINRQFGI